MFGLSRKSNHSKVCISWYYLNHLIIGHVVPFWVAAQVGAIWRRQKHAACSLVGSISRQPEVCALAFETRTTPCGAVELAADLKFLENSGIAPQCTKNEAYTSFPSFNFTYNIYNTNYNLNSCVVWVVPCDIWASIAIMYFYIEFVHVN